MKILVSSVEKEEQKERKPARRCGISLKAAVNAIDIARREMSRDVRNGKREWDTHTRSGLCASAMFYIYIGSNARARKHTHTHDAFRWEKQVSIYDFDRFLVSRSYLSELRFYIVESNDEIRINFHCCLLRYGWIILLYMVNNLT